MSMLANVVAGYFRGLVRMPGGAMPDSSGEDHSFESTHPIRTTETASSPRRTHQNP